jgi:hypothetical protein
MWNSGHLTIQHASAACYMDSFTFLRSTLILSFCRLFGSIEFSHISGLPQSMTCILRTAWSSYVAYREIRVLITSRCAIWLPSRRESARRWSTPKQNIKGREGREGRSPPCLPSLQTSASQAASEHVETWAEPFLWHSELRSVMDSSQRVVLAVWYSFGPEQAVLPRSNDVKFRKSPTFRRNIPATIFRIEE